MMGVNQIPQDQVHAPVMEGLKHGVVDKANCSRICLSMGVRGETPLRIWRLKGTRHQVETPLRS